MATVEANRAEWIAAPPMALTICQPWAWAIVNGPKRAENRSWSTTYRGPLLIHAGKSRQWYTPYLNDGSPAPAEDALAYGAAVGIADLVACVHHASYVRWPGGMPAVVAAMRSAFAEGPYCWVLDNVRPLVEPVPMRGAQGLWRPTVLRVNVEVRP